MSLSDPEVVATLPSMAVIRDPKERIISSWKSKITCYDVEYHTDVGDRKKFVNELLNLAGLPTAFASGLPDSDPESLCLSLTEFL